VWDTKYNTKIPGGLLMAKKKGRKDKMQKTRFKGDQVDDERIENYELSEEFIRDNPLKTAPNTPKNKKKKS
jgi:hypothetical protein